MPPRSYRIRRENEKGEPDDAGLPVTRDQDGRVLSSPYAGDSPEPGTTDPDAPKAPPLKGKGSDVGAWRKYATALDLAVNDGASKAELIAQLRSIGAVPPGDDAGEEE
jgi:hypothetical protein